ncbi:hypothetical protein QBC39DRAFT_333877 [Podospora conica]|nr:hypothetical protein QBC39DRAFT_333877 [Schizothecium conicum]
MAAERWWQSDGDGASANLTNLAITMPYVTLLGAEILSLFLHYAPAVGHHLSRASSSRGIRSPEAVDRHAGVKSEDEGVATERIGRVRAIQRLGILRAYMYYTYWNRLGAWSQSHGIAYASTKGRRAIPRGGLIYRNPLGYHLVLPRCWGDGAMAASVEDESWEKRSLWAGVRVVGAGQI